jgi:cytochrome c
MRKIVLGTAMAAFLAAAPGLAQAACALSGDAAEGAKVSKACTSCHVFEAGKPSRPTGPNLHDVMGRGIGEQADYTRYSEAATAAKGKVTWDEAKVADYVKDPKEFLKKANGKEMKHGMNFKLSDATKAKQVAAFLTAIKGKAECP